MAVVCLGLLVGARSMGWPWQTMVFTALALLQLGHALAVRSERESFFTLGVWSNQIAFVPLGTPLLAGPGSDRGDHGVHARGEHGARAGRGGARAGQRARAVADAAVRGVVRRVLEQPGIELVTPISGLLLTAIAVQLVADAAREFLREASDRPPA
jgi:multiple antibiotic resistance protein